jgi:cytochrome bd-type quinol oxidase subunit 1
MAHSLPRFYAALPTVKAVEYAKRGDAMKDFFKAALWMAGLLALVIGVRVAAFVNLHHEALGTENPAAMAAMDGGCAVTDVKMPCFRKANPETAAPRQSADLGTVVPQDPRCAARAVKMPCLQGADKRS